MYFTSSCRPIWVRTKVRFNQKSLEKSFIISTWTEYMKQSLHHVYIRLIFCRIVFWGSGIDFLFPSKRKPFGQKKWESIDCRQLQNSNCKSELKMCKQTRKHLFLLASRFVYATVSSVCHALLNSVQYRHSTRTQTQACRDPVVCVAVGFCAPRHNSCWRVDGHDSRHARSAEDNSNVRMNVVHFKRV